uniref:Uncharacterized protein AlNc14C163G7825 n=1 Tax=Albugo laibachii Nc14 TaxID=890382 RepID=F0WMY8_9STRA|nr:conserved hypothetical protein [Albugo laibachii Nc14]|eukprot:CCA22675.1 conserved hypothetical protein [Albugo laibachii Nc14]
MLCDSDDDIPLSQLAKKMMNARGSKESQESDHNSSSLRGDSLNSSKKTSNKRVQKAKDSLKQTEKKKIKIEYKQQECTEELYQTLKGKLVQQLLCRWWYAIEWPVQDTSNKPPKSQELDGFRGAFILVKGEGMGSITDTRPANGKPSFLHFFALPSKQIQTLLVKAYQNQIKTLIKHEGTQAPLLAELRRACQTAEKMDTEKADTNVASILKKYQKFAQQIASSQ